jgi:hypothetical protein
VKKDPEPAVETAPSPAARPADDGGSD